MSMPNLFLFVMFKYSHFAIYLKWILVADKNAVLLQDGLHSCEKITYCHGSF